MTEPTGYQTWIACRGSDYGVIRVPAGRATRRFASPTGVSVAPSTRSTRRWCHLGDHRVPGRWTTAAGSSHPYLSPPSLLPTLARAGEWAVTYPASCELTIAVMYLPAQADASGWGSEVRREVEEWIARETAQDDWLREHPPVIEWWPNRVMPFEISPDAPIVGVMQAATPDVGHPGRLGGLDSWYDGATLTQLAGSRRSATGRPGSIPTGSASRT